MAIEQELFEGDEFETLRREISLEDFLSRFPIAMVRRPSARGFVLISMPDIRARNRDRTYRVDVSPRQFVNARAQGTVRARANQ